MWKIRYFDFFFKKFRAIKLAKEPIISPLPPILTPQAIILKLDEYWDNRTVVGTLLIICDKKAPEKKRVFI